MLLAPGREERRKAPPGSEASCPRGLLSRARGLRRLQSALSTSKLPRAGGIPPGGGLERGRRPPLLFPPLRPRRLLPSSRLARCGRHRPSRGRRARNGACLAASPRGCERGSLGARRPPRPAAPETASETNPRPGALCPAGSQGSARPTDRRLLRGPNDNRGRREEERKGGGRESGREEGRKRKGEREKNSIYIYTCIMNTIYMAYTGFIDLLNAKLRMQYH